VVKFGNQLVQYWQKVRHFGSVSKLIATNQKVDYLNSVFWHLCDKIKNNSNRSTFLDKYVYLLGTYAVFAWVTRRYYMFEECKIFCVSSHFLSYSTHKLLTRFVSEGWTLIQNLRRSTPPPSGVVLRNKVLIEKGYRLSDGGRRGNGNLSAGPGKNQHIRDLIQECPKS